MSHRNSRKKGFSITECIKFFDFYRVMPREMTEPSMTGASSKFHFFNYWLLVSLISMSILMIMIITNYANYLTIEGQTEFTLQDPTTI